MAYAHNRLRYSVFKAVQLLDRPKTVLHIIMLRDISVCIMRIIENTAFRQKSDLL